MLARLIRHKRDNNNIILCWRRSRLKVGDSSGDDGGEVAADGDGSREGAGERAAGLLRGRVVASDGHTLGVPDTVHSVSCPSFALNGGWVWLTYFPSVVLQNAPVGQIVAPEYP